MQKPNPYKILQLDPQAEPEVIKAAYKRLAAKYHPDVNKDPNATERMQEINMAYEILSNPSLRARYDANNTSSKTPSTPKQKLTFTFSSGQVIVDPVDLVDITMNNWFEALNYFLDAKQFKTWFKKLHRNDLILALNNCQNIENVHEALFSFLKHLKPDLPPPLIDINVSQKSVNISSFEQTEFPEFKLSIENKSAICCVGRITFSDHSWISQSDIDFFVAPNSISELNVKINPDKLVCSNSFETTIQCQNNSSNAPVFNREITLSTCKHPKIVYLEKIRDDGKYKEAFQIANVLDCDDGFIENQIDAIKKHRLKLYSKIFILSFFFNALVGIWINYANVYTFNFIPIMLVSGSITLLFFFYKFAGKYGKLTDIFISAFSGIIAVVVVIILMKVILFVVAIILAFIVLSSPKKR